MKRREILGVGIVVSTSGCLRLLEEGETEGNQSVEDEVNGENEENGENEGSGIEVENAPAGIDDDGVSPLLADAHSRALLDTSYTLEFDELNVSGRQEHWRRVSVEGDRMRVEFAPAEKEVFIRDGTEFWWQRDAGRDWYGRRDIEGGTVPDTQSEHATFSFVLADFIRAGSFDPPVAQEEDGVTGFGIEANAVGEPNALSGEWGFQSVDDLSIDGFVDAEGVVRRFEVEVEGVRNDELELFTLSIQTRGLGETEVSEPDWVQTAEDRAPELTASLVDDSTALVITHLGGQMIPAGTEVTLWDATSGRTAVLEQPLTPDEELYVAYRSDEIELSRESPDGGDQIDSNWNLRILLNSEVYAEKPINLFS